MTHAHIIAGLIGIFLSFIIYFLVRRDRLSPHVAARWFFVATVVAALGMFPNVVDYIGEHLGIGYPPILAVILAICAALIKILLMDIERQRMLTKIDRLVQRVAILEDSVEYKNRQSDQAPTFKVIDIEKGKKYHKSNE